MNKSNVTGGRLHKKLKKRKQVVQEDAKIILKTKDEDQIYACVERKMGGSRMMVKCSDGETRSAIIPGKLYKRVWLNPGDIVLCEVEKSNNLLVCYITYKYNEKEIAMLKSQGKINFDRPTELNDQDNLNIKIFEDDHTDSNSDNDNDSDSDNNNNKILKNKNNYVNNFDTNVKIDLCDL